MPNFTCNRLQLQIFHIHVVSATRWLDLIYYPRYVPVRPHTPMQSLFRHSETLPRSFQHLQSFSRLNLVHLQEDRYLNSKPILISPYLAIKKWQWPFMKSSLFRKSKHSTTRDFPLFSLAQIVVYLQKKTLVFCKLPVDLEVKVSESNQLDLKW